MKFSAVLSSNLRSFIYIKELVDKSLYPSSIIFLINKKNKFLNNKIFKVINKIDNISIYKYEKNTIDDPLVVSKILNLKEKVVIYSGYGGKIIKSKKLLNNKLFLHSHPGKLPSFKGSTTIYYSILKLRKIYCTTFIMNSSIDEGRILLVKEYALPKDFKELDAFDNYMRIQNIIIVLKSFAKFMKIKQKKYLRFYPHYYIAHPILRYLVF